MQIDPTMFTDSRMTPAMNELKQMILARYPEATFSVAPRYEPVPGTYLTVMVDVEDTDAVMEVIIERLLIFQVEDELSLYPVIDRPRQQVPEESRQPERIVVPASS